MVPATQLVGRSPRDTMSGPGVVAEIFNPTIPLLGSSRIHEHCAFVPPGLKLHPRRHHEEALSRASCRQHTRLPELSQRPVAAGNYTCVDRYEA
jgi:hypothetical protein